MSNVRIITDSAADLPIEIVAERGIRVVPLYVTLGGVTLRDGVELKADDLYDKMQNDKAQPLTSQPSPEDFRAALVECGADSAEVLCLTISSNLSGTFQSAQLALELIGPSQNIALYDTLNASLGEGLKVLIAHDLAKQGRSKSEIIEHLNHVKIRDVFTVDSLKYLERGGRISKPQAAMAAVLDIKPILTLSADGRIESETKVRGRQKSIRYFIDLLKEDLSTDYDGYVGLGHAACQGEAEKLIESIKSAFPHARIITGQLGAAIGSHVGPGCLALFYEKR